MIGKGIKEFPYLSKKELLVRNKFLSLGIIKNKNNMQNTKIKVGETYKTGWDDIVKVLKPVKFNSRYMGQGLAPEDFPEKSNWFKVEVVECECCQHEIGDTEYLCEEELYPIN